MEKKLTITAISGWAVPETWFAERIKEAFPGSDVHVVYPENPENEEEAQILFWQGKYQDPCIE